MRSSVRRFASSVLLLLLLALPAAAAGTKAPAASVAPAGAVETVAGGLLWLWQTAVHLVTPAGHRSAVTSTCDLGPGMDPDGGCAARSRPRPTLGPGMDPDG